MIVAVIPARGGSKRIPRKNIKLFHAKPIIAYSIEAAKKADIFDEIIVSTDDEEIAEISREYGATVPFIRSADLSGDFVGTKEVTNNAIDELAKDGKKIDFVCTIYATAPFIDPAFIIKGFEELKNSSAKHAFSVTTMPFAIQRAFKMDSSNRCEMFTPENYYKRSQDLETSYQDAAQFYWENLAIKSDEILFGKDSIGVVIPRHLVQDIDTLEDWIRAEYMYEAISRDKK
jgi:pseudaminic acid cytidylyltransferase